ncbi:hypothetical protein [Pajaroellobacter abortibovis]|uniref:PE-PGRS family protein n=1 Tax=Pajaroellobacter abortibovis TaxID=1882918 RepID=A0A1L6MW98_9BACT|nr:hypothetical protein [Pajaroellobacter abortibovis]APR99802.1 hypothetical protein BCY86_03255 [Pajaroellobacter abortibovis]
MRGKSFLVRLRVPPFLWLLTLGFPFFSACEDCRFDHVDDWYADDEESLIDSIERGKVIFVSSDAKDDGEGTKTSPMTLTAVVQKLANKRKMLDPLEEDKWFLLLCGTKYSVPLRLWGQLHSSLVVKGRYDCDTWEESDQIKTEIRVDGAGPALWLRGVKNVRIRNIDFFVGDGGQGESSIAGFVGFSSQVALMGVSLHAGRGGDGLDGREGESYDPPISLGGGDGVGVQGGKGAICQACNGICVNGGDGGNGVSSQQLPSSGMDACGGAKGGEMDDDHGSGPKKGEDGAHGVPGAGGKRKNGTLTINQHGLLVLPSGADGEDGSPGMGGGGGGGTYISGSGSGGGGGCGGCGGKKGEGGKSGGWSIGLVSFKNTELSLDNVKIGINKAGNGGKGGEGHDGQQGGPGGNGAGSSIKGANGGSGGNGGKGGSGAGGPGGFSVSILCNKTSQPAMRKVTYEEIGGWAGKGGPGGEGADKGEDGQVFRGLFSF